MRLIGLPNILIRLNDGYHFWADIFLGKYDDNKYVQQVAAEFEAKKPVVLDDIAKQWIEAIKAKTATLEQIEDVKYREFIKAEVMK